MRIAMAPYILERRDGRGTRQGALLRIGDGYADLHPWETLGDLPLRDQIATLRVGGRTPLLARAFATAKLDGEARGAGVSLFEGLAIPESHALLSGFIDEIRSFARVKVKCTGASLGDDLARLDAELPKTTKLRVDLNGTAREDFLTTVEPYAARIDFIEDPFYDGDRWHTLPADLPVRLARDRAFDDAGRAAVRILKPAVDDPMEMTWTRAVVTSYLDHPIGQVTAAYWAARLAARYPDRMEPAGVLAHLVYENNAFSELLATHGARLLQPEGTGLGFDSLLERLAWTELL